MNKNNQFNQDEIENSIKTFEEQFKGKKIGLRFDDYFVSRPTNLAQYYLFWRIKKEI